MARQLRQIKGLDISSKKVYFPFNLSTIQSPVNFQHNRNLLEMAMRTCHPKGFESEASKGLRFPLGGFSILGVFPSHQSLLGGGAGQRMSLTE